MTNYYNIVLEYFPNATEKDVNDLLWCCTAFPFCDIKHTRKQLEEIKERSNGDIQLAIAISHEDLDKAMEQVNELESNAIKSVNLTYDHNKDIYLLWLKDIPHEINHWEMNRLQELCNGAYLIKSKEV